MWEVAVRVKLQLVRDEKVVTTVALINSGYEADSPQLIIPIQLAKQLNLWPPPSNSKELIFDTAGGPLRVWFIPRAAKAKVVTKDVESKEVTIDIAISPLADEALISDILAGELEIAVEDFAKGYWRFRWEPKEKIRPSEKKL